MKTLNFYDVVKKVKFNSNKYKKYSKLAKGRKMYYAIAVSPSGTRSSRILSKDDYDSN